jgi:predicted amidohydrolase YtcJ
VTSHTTAGTPVRAVPAPAPAVPTPAMPAPAPAVPTPAVPVPAPAVPTPAVRGPAVPTPASAAPAPAVPPVGTAAGMPGSATAAIPRPVPSSVAAPTRGTLLTADRIVTLGRGRTRARALVIRGSRVVWVGDDEADAPPYRDRLDLHGCVIGPAFVDAHAHLTMSGLSLGGLDLSEVSSGEELLRAVATYAGQHTGRVIWGHGLDPHRFPDPLPDPDALSRVAPGQAVYLSRIDGHAGLIDRTTLAAAPLARAEGIELTDAGPTGVIRREANHVVRRWSVGAMSESELSSARSAAIEQAASLGIASVHEMGGPDIMGLADFDAWVQGPWPIEVVPYWSSLEVDVPLERDLRHVGGDLLLDGSLGAHTAALLAPYSDAPSLSGHLEYDDETITRWFLEATRAGLQTGVHAVGDAALAQVVRCWRAVADHLAVHGDQDAIQRGRHRIEHAEVLTPDLLDGIAELGLLISAQPGTQARWGGPDGMYRARLGADRAAWTNPFRALADRGIPIAFGSDAIVTPMDPWGIIHAAEHHPEPRHSVGRLEAVSMSSLGGRTAARQDRFVGIVRAGLRADLAVFEGDPYAAEDPRPARCVLTIVQGRVAHGQAPLPPAPGL